MYTLAETQELLRDAVRRFPDRRNPTNGAGQCLYTSNDGSSHCVVGQILADIGVTPPGPNFFGCVQDVLEHFDFKDLFDEYAQHFLRRAQMTFDGFWPSYIRNGQPTWAEALATLEIKGYM